MESIFNPLIQQKLPKRVSRLEELAYNFWWSWHRSARDLFKALDPTLWKDTRHNPVRILLEVPQERLDLLAKDPTFLRQYDGVLLELDRDLRNGHLWYTQTHSDLLEDAIVYFSAEFGVHSSLPIYSGGLGVLAGDHTKEASDLGIPFLGVGFLYEQGYFRQQLDHSGWQQAIYPALNPQEVALQPHMAEDGTQLTVQIIVVTAYCLAGLGGAGWACALVSPGCQCRTECSLGPRTDSAFVWRGPGNAHPAGVPAGVEAYR